MKFFAKKENPAASFVAEVLGEYRTPRRCVICPNPATRAVYRLQRASGGTVRIDRSSRQFACYGHADERLWTRITPKMRLGLAVFPPRFAQFKGDLFNFYRDVVREVGGVMPRPYRDKETKPRKKCWAPAPQMRFEPAKKPGVYRTKWA